VLVGVGGGLAAQVDQEADRAAREAFERGPSELLRALRVAGFEELAREREALGVRRVVAHRIGLGRVAARRVAGFGERGVFELLLARVFEFPQQLFAERALAAGGEAQDFRTQVRRGERDRRAALLALAAALLFEPALRLAVGPVGRVPRAAEERAGALLIRVPEGVGRAGLHARAQGLVAERAGLVGERRDQADGRRAPHLGERVGLGLRRPGARPLGRRAARRRLGDCREGGREQRGQRERGDERGAFHTS
jgi:hypothetical protein